jgi:hypothetical protein
MRLKKFLCVLISIILIISSAGVTFYITEISLIYSDYRYYKDSGTNIFKDHGVTLANYYSKTPTDIDPIELSERCGFSSDIQMLYKCVLRSQETNTAIMKVTYRGLNRKVEKRVGLVTETEFEVIETVYGRYSADTGDSVVIWLPKTALHYRTAVELLLYHYGLFYEKGETYLIYYCGTFGPDGILAVCKLSGDYPSIKMIPGPVEYDATYFGAETKYVSADEFIELFIKAARESGVRT